ncbi:MAG: class I SAM-dependent methyltransferase [Acidimicrobiales bacterium]|nr:class I SAM-dependent methyltransferase [Acidimicrobiales bacterium]
MTQMTAIANTEMAAVWDGEEGDGWTENADRYDATDRYIGARFEREVPIEPTDSVLDVGCGTGKSSRDAARRAHHGSVLGVDLSSRMLADARRRSELEGLTNLQFLQADAQVHPFEPAAHDLAVSVFGAMFFNDPAAAFANIVRSLRPGGRLAMLSWREFEHNEWLTTIFETLAAGRELPTPPPGSPGPFGLADQDAVANLLVRAGLTDVELLRLDEPIWIGSDVDDAWAFLSAMGLVRGLAEGLDKDTKQGALDSLRDRLAAYETPDGVLMGSAAWLITAQRPPVSRN